MKSEYISKDFGFVQSIFVPELFLLFILGNTQMITVKVVDKILISGLSHDLQKIVSIMQARFELSTITFGPKIFKFLELKIGESEDSQILYTQMKNYQLYRQFQYCVTADNKSIVVRTLSKCPHFGQLIGHFFIVCRCQFVL